LLPVDQNLSVGFHNAITAIAQGKLLC